jgi:hypothetical protein
MIDGIATRQLGVFAEIEPELILSADYQAEDCVIVETKDLWLNVRVHDWCMTGFRCLANHIA